MRTIQISDEDYEFLKDLQHELNTQTNDGNAEPVYWGVREYNYELTLEGEGEPRITYDDGAYTLEEAVEAVNECIGDYDEETQTEWNGIDKTDADDVAYFMKETLKWDYSDIYWVEEKARITNETGAFITKRACKEYIQRYGYNHCRPHTYAMTAYRNYELGQLLKILKTMVFGDGQQLQSEELEAERDNVRQEMLDKACKWIDDNAFRYVVTGDVHGVSMTALHSSITEDFRKAMEK